MANGRTQYRKVSGPYTSKGSSKPERISGVPIERSRFGTLIARLIWWGLIVVWGGLGYWIYTLIAASL